MTEPNTEGPGEYRLWQVLLPQLQLDFHSAIYHHCSPEWRIVPRVIRDEMLNVIHGGTVGWRIGNEEFESPPGGIVFCPPHVKWEAWRASNELVRMTVIHFDAVLPGGQRYLQTLNYPFHILPAGFGRMEALARTLCRSYSDQKAGHELKERAILFDVFHRLFPHHGAVSPAGGPGQQMLEIAAFLKAHLHEDITRELLARKFHLSSGHLAARFKEYLGQSPIEYLIHLRVQRASRLLRTTELSVGEIGRKVGYEDVAYFSRIFRRETGVSPSQFRREL